ncbi:MAG: hypothetical protein RML95_09410 [Anaerolineae bacterium]|nr:hypothetical protein [Anaerolineae bacterium]
MSRKWLVCLISLVLLLVLPTDGQLTAQESQEARAIALAAAHPRLASYLADLPNWSAVAYNPEGLPNVWRVLFQTAQGEKIAEVDVLLKPERVLWLKVDYSYMSQATQRKGQEAALKFALAHPDVRAILGELIDKYEAHAQYEWWHDAWAVYLWYGGQAVQAVVRFNSANPLEFGKAELIGITFPETPSVEAWLSGRRTQAITIAAQDGQVAARLREHSGWQAEALPESTASGAVWRVTFKQGESTIAQAWVDLTKSSLIRVTLP